MQNANVKERDIESLAKYMVCIDTSRLTLKTLTTDTMSPEYLAWLRDSAMNRYLEARHMHHTGESVAQFVEDMFASDKDLLMGIFLKSTGKHIGNIKLGGVDRVYSRADVGIIIGDQNLWGNGYATEAIEGLSDFSFGSISLRRLYAGAYASNKGSIKAFLKAGFQQEGILKGHWIVNGEPEDGVLLGKLSCQAHK
jgi:RimJ/RimL family protein N-acetyltransferase